MYQRSKFSSAAREVCKDLYPEDEVKQDAKHRVLVGMWDDAGVFTYHTRLDRPAPKTIMAMNAALGRMDLE